MHDVLPPARLLIAAALLSFSAVGMAQRAASIQDIDEPGRSPFSRQKSTTTFYASFTVPTGMRHIADAFSAYCVVDGAAMTGLSIIATVDGQPFYGWAVPHQLSASAAANVAYYAMGHGPIYADAGTDIVLYAYTSNGLGGRCNFSITGHSIRNP